LSPDESKAIADGTYGIATYSGSGAKYAPFETFTPVTFTVKTGPSATTSLPRVTSAGLEVGVKASNLPGDVYAAIIERGTESEVSTDEGYVAFMYQPPVVNGSSEFTLVAPKGNLDRSKQYEVIIWKSHNGVNASTLYARSNINMTDELWDKLAGTVTRPPATKPTPKPATPSQQAGSLSWGVSSNFADYVTNPNRPGGMSGGRIDTSGVGKSGGAFLFPQATGGSWNKSTQTGSVQFSGIVTFYAHHGGINRSFANPVITVSSATSGSISVNGASYALNLAAGSTSVGSNGEVTWSNVPVNGSISGGGDGGGGSFTLDSLSFTVGAASSIQYGSTTQTKEKVEREAAATPPTTDGITVVTPEDELVAGGEIEIKAPGFEANERDILVVLYSDPIVLDRKAGANESGDVRWIGTLPEDLEPGEHTITLQGSIDAGAVITVVDADEKKTETLEQAVTTSADGSAEAVFAEVAGASSDSAWMWWVGAGALLLLAAAMGVLVVNQRRNAAGRDV
ncbi:HtaA domain-containing protein, partial [Leucobacter denitrificans]